MTIERLPTVITLILALALLLALSACSAPPDAPDIPGDDAIAPDWQEQYDLGMRYLSQGNYQEAIIAFTAAIEIDPRQAAVYAGRAEAYASLGEHTEQAINDYQTAIEIDPMFADAYLGLAEVYVEIGDIEAAMDVLREGYEATEDERLAKRLEELENEYGSQEEQPGDSAEQLVLPDELPVLTRHILYWSDGSLIVEVTHKYDEYGVRVQAEYFWVDSTWTVMSEHTVYTWAYDEDRGVYMGYENGTLFESLEKNRHEICTDFRSANLVAIYMDPYPEMINDREWRPWTATGERLQSIDLRGVSDYDTVMALAEYEYDADGNAVTIHTYDEFGDLTGHCILEWTVLKLGPDGTYIMG